MNTTTKRHPRTLNEAFPGGTEYANAVERYRRTDFSGITIVSVCGVLMAAALIAKWMLS